MNQISYYLDLRRAGVLLHPTSLPGPNSCGNIGPEAYKFIDFLATAGFSVWQMLPIGPTGPGDSPYQSTSIHAGNPKLLDPIWLQKRGWWPSSPSQTVSGCMDDVWTASWKLFTTQANADDKTALHQFAIANPWLEDYALFVALHDHFQLGWWCWPQALRDRQPEALQQAKQQWAVTIDVIKYQQFVFFAQWQELRRYANSQGVLLFGDIPIFVAHDSAEVWACPEHFDLNPDGSVRVVAGVPPDYFSATGQRWGNPLYRWERMQEDGFEFWIQRLCTQLLLFDLLRIDHFRGFEAYWEIPACEPNAVHGRWMPAGGDALFTRLREVFGKLPLVAEDLGIITPAVEALRCKHALPGMKVLQFAFTGGPTNPYLPANHTHDAVVYTGTHDNDTTLGWYQNLNPYDRHHVDENLGWPQDPMPWPLIYVAMRSVANLAVIPMQDLLSLDTQHRMNLPGTTAGNWRWRFHWDWLPIGLGERLHQLLVANKRVITVR